MNITEETNFYPTHSCFDDAFEYIELMIKHKPHREIREQYFIVHGICLMPDDTPFAHAWVEHPEKGEEACTFKAIAEGQEVFCTADKPGFYEYYRVQKCTRYSMLQALKMNRQTGNLGPWAMEYKLLCGTDKKQMKPNATI